MKIDQSSVDPSHPILCVVVVAFSQLHFTHSVGNRYRDRAKGFGYYLLHTQYHQSRCLRLTSENKRASRRGGNGTRDTTTGSLLTRSREHWASTRFVLLSFFVDRSFFFPLLCMCRYMEGCWRGVTCHLMTNALFCFEYMKKNICSRMAKRQEGSLVHSNNTVKRGWKPNLPKKGSPLRHHASRNETATTL